VDDISQAFYELLSTYMNKSERVAYIQRRLDELYPQTPIPLDHHDPYTLLIAVLLSAQSTDKKVNEVTPPLFARADNPQAMTALPVAEIEHMIRVLGLAPQKAKAIAGLSRMLIDRHGGRVPDNFADLEALPGVGHKTASVVMCQAFGQPAFPVDTHIHRLAQRWGLTSGRSVEQTERDLKRLFPQSAWNRLHLQFIYYGREHCTARGCDGTRCEICRTCFPRRRTAVTTKKA
jgi:endonuclease-3